MDGELLTGGGLNQVFRVGDAVRRPAGPWAPRVHDLLRHLAPLGIAPVPLALDDEHELLTYLPGDVGHVFPSDDASLVESALMLRRLHDTTIPLVDRLDGWPFPPESRWRLFREAYGCCYEDEPVLMRLEDMITTIRGHPASVWQRAERHDDHYLGLVEYVQANRA